MSSVFDAFLATPDESMKTSHSEVELFLKCERAHYYSYGKELRSKKGSDAMVRGTVGHEYLAVYYTYLMDGMNVTVAAKQTLEELATFMMNHPENPSLAIYGEVYYLLDEYFKIYNSADSEIEVLAVEQEFNIPVGKDFFLKMFVDLIVRMPNHGIVVWDHKFVYNFFDPEVEAVLPQLPKYVGALKSVGYNVTGAMYNEIRWRDTAENKATPAKRFQRGFVDLSKNRILQTVREQITAARRIRDLKQLDLEEWSNSVLRTANSNACRNCPFLEICAADLEGRDTVLMEEYNYAKKEKDRNG